MPKTTLADERPSRRGPIGLLTLISIVVFVAALAGWGSIFLYKVTLEKNVEVLEASLEKAKEAFEPRLLKVFEDLDRKLSAAGALVGEHTTLVPLFNHLEETTVQTVRFRSFDYKINPDGKIIVVMNGQAPDYDTVALQADSFGDSNYIINPIFSDLDLDQFGNVKFKVTFAIDPVLVSYTRALTGS